MGGSEGSDDRRPWPGEAAAKPSRPASPIRRSRLLLVVAALFLVVIRVASAAAASTPAEDWARERICAGEPADFNTRLGAVADPRQAKPWDDQRLLSADFLIDLVTASGDACKVPPHGVDIVGAWFRAPIDLQGANIPFQIRIRGSRFDAPVQLGRARAEKLVSFAGSRFGKALMMTEIGVRGSLFLGEGASFEDRLVLWGASIDGQASFAPESIDLVEVTKPADRAAPDNADPPRLTRFGGTVDLTGVRVGRILDLREIDARKDVILDRARIDGDLRLSGSRFAGTLSMDSLKVGESVEAWGVAWGEQTPDGDCVAHQHPATAEWRFYYADIGANVYLSGACLADLAVFNFAGSRVRGQLFLGSIDHYPANAWGERSIMILRNASVGKIQDLPSIHLMPAQSTRARAAPPAANSAKATDPAADTRGTATPTPMRESWPLRLELDGFTYASWDGLGRQERPTGDGDRRVVPARDERWLIGWVARDHSYSRQPYEQLARVMVAQGRGDASDDILFTSREIERCITVGGLTSDGIESCILRRSGITRPPQGDGTPAVEPASTDSRPETANVSGSDDKSEGERLVDYGVLTATWVLNGYGYRPLWALGWFAMLILIGTLLFRYRTPEGANHSVWFATEYTFDTLLPAVNLCKDFESIKIDGPIRYYFIALKVLGYVFVATLLQVFYQVVGRSIV